MQLDHVTLVAPDCNALKHFFVDVAGMQIGPRPPFGVGGYWLYLNGKAALHLISTSAAPSGEGQSATRIDHFALRIDDAGEWTALVARLDSHGYAYQQADVPLTRERQLFVRLAAGVVVEFVTLQH